MGEFKDTTAKYYKSETERLQKLDKHKETIVSFLAVMGDDIKALRLQNIRFWVFEIDMHQAEPILYAGITSCCGKTAVITEDIRNGIRDKIIERTAFKSVQWEL